WYLSPSVISLELAGLAKRLTAACKKCSWSCGELIKLTASSVFVEEFDSKFAEGDQDHPSAMPANSAKPRVAVIIQRRQRRLVTSGNTAPNVGLVGVDRKASSRDMGMVGVGFATMAASVPDTETKPNTWSRNFVNSLNSSRPV